MVVAMVEIPPLLTNMSFKLVDKILKPVILTVLLIKLANLNPLMLKLRLLHTKKSLLKQTC